MKRTLFILAGILMAACASPKNSEMKIDTPMNIHMTGAYTNYRSLTDDDKALFVETYQAEPALTPTKVATQVVAGTNYSFLCKDKDGNLYEVRIFVPLPCNEGKPEVTAVTKK